jgi:phosphatidylserine decarboxylase
MRIPIARAGWPYIIPLILISILLSWLTGWFSLPFWILVALVVNFFRDPERMSHESNTAILSPADGKIIQITDSDIPNQFADHVKLSVFMNIFNVHVNRAPMDGKIISLEHQPGGYRNAADPRSSLQNERVEITMDTLSGPVMVRLVAGLIARRIVPMTYPDSKVERGKRIGLIKFGSRVDLYLPRTCHIDVSVGDKVFAGKTKVASDANRENTNS